MRITYDVNADAVYLYLKYPMPQDETTKVCPCELFEIGAMVNFDFDQTGMLVGIEIMDARTLVPEQTLREATRLSGTRQLFR